MRKIVISVLLTLLLGPGAGHLYLKKFRRAALFILAAFVFAFHLAWQMAKTVAQHVTPGGTINQNASQLMQSFAATYPNTMLYYDIVLAALWAYAVYDVYNQAHKLLPPPPPQETLE